MSCVPYVKQAASAELAELFDLTAADKFFTSIDFSTVDIAGIQKVIGAMDKASQDTFASAMAAAKDGTAAAKELYASQGCSRRGRRDVGGCLDSCGCPKSLTDTMCVTACATTTDYTKAAANAQAVAAFTTKCLKSGGVTAGTGANTATVANTAAADPCLALKQGIASAEANLAAYDAGIIAAGTCAATFATSLIATLIGVATLV